MKKPWRTAAYLLGGAVALWLTARFFLPIGLPFLLGLGLSRAAEPLVRRLTEKAHFPRGLASFLCVTLVCAVLGSVLWLLCRGVYGELGRLAKQLPDVLLSLKEPVGRLHKWLLQLAAKLPDGFSAAAAEWLDHFFAGSDLLASSVSDWIVRFVTGTLSSVPDIVLFVLTALLSGYLFSSEGAALNSAIRRWLPEQWQQRANALWKRLKGALGGYCKAQLRLMVVTFGIVAAGLLILRRDSAILTALLIALVDALPVLGAGTILIPWAIIAFFRGETAAAVGLLLIYAAASLTRTFLEPRFLGRQIGLNPLLTLVSMYAGFRLFGMLGMILLPVGVILIKQLYDLAEPHDPPAADG